MFLNKKLESRKKSNKKFDNEPIEKSNKKSDNKFDNKSNKKFNKKSDDKFSNNSDQNNKARIGLPAIYNPIFIREKLVKILNSKTIVSK